MIEKNSNNTETEIQSAPAEETASIPSSLLGGATVEAGDVVRLKVVSVDEESGSIEVAYDHPADDDSPDMDEMTERFNKKSL